MVLVMTMALVLSRHRSTPRGCNPSLDRPFQRSVDNLEGGRNAVVPFSPDQPSLIQSGESLSDGTRVSRTNTIGVLQPPFDYTNSTTRSSLLSLDTSDTQSKQVMDAVTRFKEDPHGFDREGPARTLVGRLKPGLTGEQVQALLGLPTKREGDCWIYATSYSSFLRIWFGAEDRVLTVTSVGLE